MAEHNLLGPIGELKAWAYIYADAGLEVFPLKADKSPYTTNGFLDGSTSPEQIERWWTEHPHALIGHRIATHHVILDVDPRHNGLVTWHALRDAVGGWPVTRVHRSGRNDGGGHIWWLRPDDKLTSLKLDAWAKEHGGGHQIDGTNKWTSGIDILHHDLRYTILPPSPHPTTGEPYTWQDGRGLKVPPAPMPALLADLLTGAPVDQQHAAPKTVDEDSIADWFSATQPIGPILKDAGWELVAGDGSENGSRWRHKNATSSTSATVRHNCLFVYTPNTPFDVTSKDDKHGVTSFRAFTELEHEGDGEAAARAARILKDGDSRLEVDNWLNQIDKAKAAADEPASLEDTPEEVVEHGWEIIDLEDVLNADYIPPTPEVGARKDGSALFYRGRINGLLGESGGGKSWIAQHVAGQELSAGQSVVYIDFEDHAASLVGRLRSLGVHPDNIRKQFLYIQPQRAYSAEAVVYLEAAVESHQPSYVVIDSVGEAMAVEGAKQNDDDEVARWYRKLARRIAALGPAVTLIDHVPKARDANPLFAIGSQRKRAAIDGAAYRVEQVKALGKGRSGIVKVITAKDRNGHYAINSVAAEFHMSANDDGTDVRASLREHVAGSDRPTQLMENVSRHLEHSRALSVNQVKEQVKGRSELIARALDLLVAEGYVAVHEGARGALYHSSERPFRADTDVSWAEGEQHESA